MDAETMKMLAVGLAVGLGMLGPGLGGLLARLVTDRSTEKDKEILARLAPDRAFVGQEKLA